MEVANAARRLPMSVSALNLWDANPCGNTGRETHQDAVGGQLEGRAADGVSGGDEDAASVLEHVRRPHNPQSVARGLNNSNARASDWHRLRGKKSEFRRCKEGPRGSS